MTKTGIAVFAATAVMLMVGTVSLAETRGRHFTPEQLHEQSTLVIKGAVTEIETVAEFKISFPTRASVDTVVKGRWKEKEIAFQHKHPGLNVIFEQEYNKPQMGQKGTFYLQSRNGTLILIGYISDTEPARQAAEFAARDDRVWEVRVLHLHTGAPTGIMWINVMTEKVFVLGAEENEPTEPTAPAYAASPRR